MVSNIVKLNITKWQRWIVFLSILIMSSINGIQRSYGAKFSGASANRSDTIDILNYTINLDITDFSGKTISGNCLITCAPKSNNVAKIRLDLLKLTIDSIKVNNQTASFSYNDTLIIISLPSILNSNDTAVINIYYWGVPQKDGGGTGWGGFYFQTTHAYNLGVGFDADPHNYGRVWFPCFDNFVERSTYEFNIITDTTKRAFCNGLLQSQTNNGDGTQTWRWVMNHTIPSYLASVAVADYVSVSFDHNGMNGAIPVVYGVRASDSTKMKKSLINMVGAIDAFENAFGPHRFDRIGFNVVPFDGGAMEHATNISYPSFAVNGNKTYETLYAHELAHHWWGDLVTCETPEDMWLNEGWASFAEFIFLEHVYGNAKYQEAVRINHKDVLHYAHVYDDGYRAISGIPHAYTYGKHSYNKGADVIHTLRTYMGDSLFFDCITSFLSVYAFKSMNSNQLRDHLSSCSGLDLTPFFDNWVFAPGFPHFSIDSFVVTPNGSEFDVSIHVRQRLYNAPSYFSGVPLTITFYNELWESQKISFEMNGRCTVIETKMSILPIFGALDMEEKISDAISVEYMTINTIGDYNFENSLITFEVTSITDSALLRIEHNWVPPDRMKTPIAGLHLSDYRYWKVDGILPASFSANARLRYDGRNTTSGGYLDNTLILNSEDSLVLMYRRNPGKDWAVVEPFVLNTLGSKTDKRGYVDLPSLQLGEYAFGIYDASRPDTIVSDIPTDCDSLSGNSVPKPPIDKGFILYPNPVGSFINIEISDGWDLGNLSFVNVLGGVVSKRDINLGEKVVSVDASGWKSGFYFVKLEKKNNIGGVKKLMIIH